MTNPTNKEDRGLFSFSDSIKNGIKNANKVVFNIKEIQSIFEQASKDISKSLEDDSISLKLNPNSGLTYMVALFSKNINVEKLNNSGVISIERGDEKYDFANWFQSKEGYPFTISYENQQYECHSNKNLIAFLNNILSDGAFWFKVHSKLYPEKFQNEDYIQGDEINHHNSIED